MSHSSLYHPSWCSWEKVTCVMCNAQWESSSSTVRIKKLRNINYGHRDEPLCATVHCSRITVGPNCKNLPKIGLKKLSNWLVILILIWSNWKERKRKLCESIETCKEKFVKSHQVNLFLAGFSLLEPQCAFAPRHQWGAAHQSLIH